MISRIYENKGSFFFCFVFLNQWYYSKAIGKKRERKNNRSPMLKSIIIYIYTVCMATSISQRHISWVNWLVVPRFFFLYIFSLTGYLGYRISRIPFGMKIYIIVANMHTFASAQKHQYHILVTCWSKRAKTTVYEKNV